jgi:hypothetical protein
MGKLLLKDSPQDKALYEELSRKHKAYGSDAIWIIQNYETLKFEYPDEWIAAYQEQVIDHDADLKELMRRLQGRFKEDAGLVAVEYVSPKKVEVII